MNTENLNKSTKVVHAGTKPDPLTGAIMVPIYQTSTYVQSAPGKHKGWDYSRAGNPTRDAYEEALAAIEGAKYAMAFSSGLAAEQAIIQTLSPGDHVLVCDDVYGGTGRLFRKLFAKYGIEFDFIDMTELNNVESAIKGETKLIWVESPTNPTMKVIDIRGVVKLAGESICVVVDNTFATPIFQNPLQLGADIVVHSTTKYIGGHSDMIGGAVMTSSDKWHEEIRFVQFAAGAVPSPMESFLLHRSIKTLDVRMQRHYENAMLVSEFLTSHRKVAKVYFPGMKADPGYNLASEQMSGHSGMVSFDYQGSYDEVVAFLQKLRVFSLAESLGGVESLVNHPEQMTHASVPEELRRKLGIGPTLIRLSCGIENGQDLIADLKQAFE